MFLSLQIDGFSGKNRMQISFRAIADKTSNLSSRAQGFNCGSV
jgi:hypothetical protein